MGDSTNTVALLEACILNADHDALQIQLENNKIEQSVLDRCLMLGFQIVQRKNKIGCVAPALQLLWQFSAKWNHDFLLEHQRTPHHLICLSAGDNHDLLDLLIQTSEQTLVHVKDDYGFTALMYAVKNANINCLRILIANGAEVNIENCKQQPISLAIYELQDQSKQSPIMMTEIFDLLLVNRADVNKALFCATSLGSVECMKKLIVKGANLHYNNGFVWRMSARKGRVDLLKCLLDRGVDKDVTDLDGRSLLWWVTKSGKVDAIRYLLDLGVTMSTDLNVSEACHRDCKHCGMDMLVLDIQEKLLLNPCMEAIRMDKLDVVQLFAEYIGIRYRHFYAIRYALKYDSVTVMEYLHRCYRHPLNIKYSVRLCCSEAKHWTLLKTACYIQSIKGVQYLLEHGADLNTDDRCSSALIVAIQSSHIELVALLISNGVDISFRSYDCTYGDVLPFEAAVLSNNEFKYAGDFYVVELLLVSGCSCGVFNLEEDHNFKHYVKPENKNLMMKWKVHENNVKPLKQQCRRMILKHLSPRASKMIEKLLLPQCLIKYLSIPELDDIVYRYRRMCISYSIKPKTISGLRFFY